MSTHPFSLLGLVSPADPTRGAPPAPRLCLLSPVPTSPLLPKAGPVEALDVVGKGKRQPGSWEDGGEQVDETHSSIPPSGQGRDPVCKLETGSGRSSYLPKGQGQIQPQHYLHTSGRAD